MLIQNGEVLANADGQILQQLDRRTARPLSSPAEHRDRTLCEDLCDLLRHDQRLPSRDLSVSVRGGVAHIAGTVASAEERALVRQLAARLRGIQGVWETLEIEGQGPLKVIDIGCGRQKQHDWAIGVDCFPFEGVEVVTDLEQGLPFEDGEIDQVYAIHFLEHVRDLLGLMNEIHRVLKPDGVLHAMVPHWQFVNAVADPTHVRFFDKQTFKFFCREHPAIKPFRPLCVSQCVDHVVADLQPVQQGQPLPPPGELARFFD